MNKVLWILAVANVASAAFNAAVGNYGVTFCNGLAAIFCVFVATSSKKNG
jgi:hypothetical protein